MRYNDRIFLNNEQSLADDLLITESYYPALLSKYQTIIIYTMQSTLSKALYVITNSN
jgi:hypothetical protein